MEDGGGAHLVRLADSLCGEGCSQRRARAEASEIQVPGQGPRWPGFSAGPIAPDLHLHQDLQSLLFSVFFSDCEPPRLAWVLWSITLSARPSAS